jgi:hypothetical protein
MGLPFGQRKEIGREKGVTWPKDNRGRWPVKEKAVLRWEARNSSARLTASRGALLRSRLADIQAFEADPVASFLALS